MGARGPAPKREDQRRRRNKPAIPTTRAPSGTKTPTKAPPASRDWHPTARAWYLSLAKSGQSVFYEPSDWETARLVAEILTKLLNGERGFSQFGSTVERLMGNLLTTEGERRRMRIELQKAEPPADDPKVRIMSRYRDAAGKT